MSDGLSDSREMLGVGAAAAAKHVEPRGEARSAVGVEDAIDLVGGT